MPDPGWCRGRPSQAYPKGCKNFFLLPWSFSVIGNKVLFTNIAYIAYKALNSIRQYFIQLQLRLRHYAKFRLRSFSKRVVVKIIGRTLFRRSQAGKHTYLLTHSGTYHRFFGPKFQLCLQKKNCYVFCIFFWIKNWHTLWRVFWLTNQFSSHNHS